MHFDRGSYVEMGVPEGPGREEALLAVREATLAGKVRNRAEALKLAERISLQTPRIAGV